MKSMSTRIANRFLLTGLICLLAVAGGTLAQGSGSDRVVEARGYSSVDLIRSGDRFKIAVELKVAEGFHINSNTPTLDYLRATSVSFSGSAGMRLEQPVYPGSVKRTFEFSPETPLDVYEGRVLITAEASADGTPAKGSDVIKAAIEVQACNDTQCLAPAILNVDIPVTFAPAGAAIKQVNSEIFTASRLVEYSGGAPAKSKDTFADKLAQSGLAATLVGVFIAGLALNLTPCVFPLIPITVGFFANQSTAGSRLRRTFFLAIAYTLGLAVTYSILGVIASLSGGLFGAALQNPIVLIGLAALMVVLAMSMFGVYEFRLPSFLNQMANTQTTGGALGALVMGLTMGIVAAPCIGPFVVALLVHVGSKGSPVYGFMLFFVLALGLGAPYLFLGTFSGAMARLPRSGEWMVTVRKVFGLALVGMALYFLMPLIGDFATTAFIIFFVAAAIYLVAWESGRAKPANFAWVLRTIGAGALVAAVFLAIPRKTEAEIVWQPFSEERLAAAKREGKPVIIDAYADWCVPCKELDRLTFTDSEVRTEAESRFVPLKLDLTTAEQGSEAGRAKKNFDILGVPTVIFLDASGREAQDLRLEGFEDADDFLKRMKRVSTAALASSENGALEDKKGGDEQQVPQVSLKLLDGGEFDLESKRGKVLLLDFWATWCQPCIAEIPMFNALQKSYNERGLEIVAISLDEEGVEVVKPFLKKNPMNYTVAIGDLKLAEKFGVTESIPVAILVDKKGRIRSTHTGLTSKAVFEKEVAELLAEQS